MANVSEAVKFLDRALKETSDIAKKKEWLVAGMKELEGTKHWHEANIARYQRILSHLDNIHPNTFPQGTQEYETVDRLNKSWMELAQGVLREEILRDIPEWYQRSF